MGLDAAREKEWLLTNGIGGFSSQTILGMNTRKYHGLLIASLGDLEREMVLQQLVEEVRVGDTVHPLSINEYDGSADHRGIEHLNRFCGSVNYVNFEYFIGDICITKTIQAIEGKNAIMVAYDIDNPEDTPLELVIRPLVNCRGIHEINPPKRDFTQEVTEQGALKVSCNEKMLEIRSNYMHAALDPVWHRNLAFGLEWERGEGYVEDLYSPGTLTLPIGAYQSNKGVMTAVYADGSHDMIRISGQRGFEQSPHLILGQTAESFIVEVNGVRSIMAGYHWFRDWGRDTMISLPGLTIVCGKFDVAESIFARFIDNMQGGRIPTRFTSEGPIYYAFDGTLWMIDRLKEYIKHAGAERAKEFLAPRWGKIRSIAQEYSAHVEDGLLKHKSGTWMDTLERDDAVEVQGLWYNALHIIEGMSLLMGDGLDLGRLKSDFESSFMDRYYNGRYLDDTPGDSSLRPNQAIALSMEYSPVPDHASADILRIIDEELLTPAGLRTIACDDPKYCPRYVGGITERERAYHNGTVWPWLVGPYCKACAKVGGMTGRKYNQHILEPIIGLIGGNCIGSINEVYDAEHPHTPRGAISQAWSVAEVLRAYLEDTQQQKTL